MAITNHERVGKALTLLRAGLAPFVEREIHASIQQGLVNMEAIRRFADDPILRDKPIVDWDAAGLLKIMWETWNDTFRRTLSFPERNYVSELREVRNKWAHQMPFSSEDADRALDSMARLLTSISAPQADEISKMKHELRRLIYDEQVRGDKRKSGGALIDAAYSSTLKPWREIVTPHADVASGRYQQAEFAADLWQVHIGEGSDEYRMPEEFFRRTFLTESLKQLLMNALKRISGAGGDPVVQLQTNFGGGKTHSMLALYHAFGGSEPQLLTGIDTLMAEAEIDQLPTARRVVLVGNKISPGNPVVKPDGTVVRTLWGELAYQLGGRVAYDRIAKDDELATSPGDVLRELMVEYGPCLILIDEWVAYARQLHDQSDLPAGSFETQFSFAQALTESAKLANNCLLVVSLPASDTASSRTSQADDVEVGGIRGREALDRLSNVVARVESAWRPATAAEGFEIVRRRLFEPLASSEAYKQRDVTARAFADLYRAQSAEFPTECQQLEYEQRIQAAFPIHPEIFDRLYEDWSTLIKFQRTRGVLRLMAAVIHSLWEKGDRNPLVLPSTIPIDDGRVKFELTRYLSDNWVPIIEKDVDGPSSLPLKLDNEVPNLGKLHATRRVARTIYLGSAPTEGTANRGIEDRRVKLGCVMPGESPAIFGDALRRLAATATYLYQDGPRAWYSTQPTVTKLADDRAEQLKRNPDRVLAELDARLRTDLRKSGDFSRIHTFPRSGVDVPDEIETRLVVLPPDFLYSREDGNPAEAAANTILMSRGNTPRVFRNALVFLAADKTRMSDLDEALRKYIAWSDIINETVNLDLKPHQVKQAETQKQSADTAVTARIPETYCWTLVPEQRNPQSPTVWQAIRLTSTDALAVRTTKKLQSDGLLVTALGPNMLRKELDKIPLWRGNHVSVRQLMQDFASYLYLPRLATPNVLISAIDDGVRLSSWQLDSFAFAESVDESKGRFVGLIVGERVSQHAITTGILVQSEAAFTQWQKEISPPPLTQSLPLSLLPQPHNPDDGDNKPLPPTTPPPQTSVYRRYHGTVQLDPTRMGRDAGQIAEAIVALLQQSASNVSITLEITAHFDKGVDDKTKRDVTENSRTLRFTNHGFEEE